MTWRGKHCGKRRNCLFWAISSFVTMFSKSRLLQRRQKASIWGKGLTCSFVYWLSRTSYPDSIFPKQRTKCMMLVTVTFVNSSEEFWLSSYSNSTHLCWQHSFSTDRAKTLRLCGPCKELNIWNVCLMQINVRCCLDLPCSTCNCTSFL